MRDVMTARAAAVHWKVLSGVVELRSDFLTLIGERLQDTAGHDLEYGGSRSLTRS